MPQDSRLCDSRPGCSSFGIQAAPRLAEGLNACLTWDKGSWPPAQRSSPSRCQACWSCRGIGGIKLGSAPLLPHCRRPFWLQTGCLIMQAVPATGKEPAVALTCRACMDVDIRPAKCQSFPRCTNCLIWSGADAVAITVLQVSWPLSIVVDDQVLGKYNQILIFLMQVTCS